MKPPAAQDLDLLDSPVPTGLTVIEASAGTGKTYSISHLVPRLLIDGALPDIGRLLLVTFTKDAARELAGRVRRVLLALDATPVGDESASAPDLARLRALLARRGASAGERLRRAVRDLDLLTVSTIHSFCQRTLQQEGALCGLPVLPEVLTDDAPLLEAAVRARWLELLSHDETLAALATAAAWSWSDAAAYARLRRTRPDAVQTPAAVPGLSAGLDQARSLHARITEPGAAEETLTTLAGVKRWNKGLDFPRVEARLRDFVSARHAEIGFWTGLDEMSRLDEYVPKRGADAARRDALVALPWLRMVRELERLAATLRCALHRRLADLVDEDIAGQLAARRLITQDGLVSALHHALHRRDEPALSDRLADRLAQRYHVGLIDESQDTDPRQFEIFQRVFIASATPRPLLLVGDPKQAIYGFRGADLSTYLRARSTALARYTLRYTRRSPPALVEAVNTLFGGAGAFHHPDLDFSPAVSALASDTVLRVGARELSRLECWLVPDADQADYATKTGRLHQLSRRVAATIGWLLSARAEFVSRRLDRVAEPEVRTVSPADFAVLVSTHEQGARMVDALERLGLPAVLDSGADVFATEEAEELRHLLAAILEPRRSDLLRRALATRLLGLRATEIAALGDASDFDWCGRFTHWRDLWRARGLAALWAELDKPVGPADQLCGTRTVSARLASDPAGGERRVTNHRQLTDLLLRAEQNVSARSDDLLVWLGQQIARARERCDVEERQLQLASDRAAVQVMTMHKAKGLEFPLVFCPYLADPLHTPSGLRLVPSRPATDNSPELLVDLPTLEMIAPTEAANCRLRLSAAQLEERLRLAYVALTRAKVRVWTCCYRSASRFDRGSPLDWLLRPADERTAHPTYDESWVERVKAGGAARLADALLALGAKPGDDDSFPPAVITFNAPPSPAASRNAPLIDIQSQAPVLRARPAPPLPTPWRVTSFSRLTREHHAHGAPGPSPAGAGPAVEADAGTPLFFSAPGGADIGTVVHDWIQAWDFSPVDRGSVAACVARAGLGARAGREVDWVATLGELFETLRETRLPGLRPLPLSRLCPTAHASEWHFHMPLAGSFSAAALAECYARHAPPGQRPYADHLRALSGEEVTGLLQGFIDRLVRDEDQWGVIDWKTNRLGPTLADYEPAALLACAMECHYLLQTHLYLVALRRHLRATGLATARLAGAWLVFLRAVAPGTSRGILHLDPPEALLDALDARFASPARDQ